MILARCVALCIFLTAAAHAAPEITERQEPLDPRGLYVPVDLKPLANASNDVTFPAEKVTIRRVPFDVINGGDNHLSVEPLGWNDVNDESRAYPGYMAKYDKREDASNPTRAIAQIPVADYANAWLLAHCDDDESLSNILTLRFGIIDGAARTTYHDFEVEIPRAGQKPPHGSVLNKIPTPQGDVYLMKVPIGKALAHLFKDQFLLDLDFTKAIRIAVNLPDPYRYQTRPLGKPSGVRIYALTLERNPIQIAGVDPTEPGGVFNQPQHPTFDVTMFNHVEHWRIYHFEAEVTDDEGNVTHHKFDEFRNARPTYRMPWMKQRIELPITRRGHYRLRINLVKEGKRTTGWHETNFCILAPDTRQYRDESPFGTWDFGGTHGTPIDEDLRGSVAAKAGWRYMFDSEKYGLITMRDLAIHDGKTLERLVAAEKENPETPDPPRLLIFHETAVSGPHVTRTPDAFTDREPYTFSEKEQARFDELLAAALNAYKTVRAVFPNTQVYFGNGVPHTVEAFLQRGFPKDLLKIAGNESGSFMRPPETQPLDFVANNGGLWMFRYVLDHYGYQYVKLYQCFEMCYPNDNPGNLSSRTQAAYYVRHIMHSLSWRIPLIRPGCFSDMGNSYYHSNWGSSGFMTAWPDVSPKPAYVAYAVLTQQLDGAEFVRAIPTGSSVVYALEFRLKDGSYATCLWTPRGKRDVTCEWPKPIDVTETCMLGRSKAVELSGVKGTVTISPEPIYLHASSPIVKAELGQPMHDDSAPTEQAVVVDALDSLDGWSLDASRSMELDVYNFMSPRKPGDFAVEAVGELAGHTGAVKVLINDFGEGSKFYRSYTQLVHEQGIELPGEPTEIGVWVHAKGNWGRVIFELEDASGQRWISLGAEQAGAPNPWLADWMSAEAFAALETANLSDWNSNDAWGRSYFNHDGWRFVTMVAPGQYPGDGYHWPRNSQWRWTGGAGDGKVHYPLKLRKLVVTAPQQVLFLSDMIDAPDTTVHLDALTVDYKPIEDAIAE